MSRDWLLHEGQVFADALVLSHTEQLRRLASVVPQAVPAAVVAGDPCYDRMLASRSLRERYRRALGVEDSTVVITMSSTWGPDSLMGSWPRLPGELLAELPLDSYRLLLVLHPHVWFAHGRWQLKSWLADCVRAGLTLIEPLAGWQQAVLAADLVIGDHGAVTGYAAALGVATMLAAFPSEDVVEGTAIAALGRTAPSLVAHHPLREQVDAAYAGHTPGRFREVAELVSSYPNESADELRGLFYRLLRLPQPGGGVPVHPLPVGDLPAHRPRVPAALVAGTVQLDEVCLDDGDGGDGGERAPLGGSATVALSRLPADVIYGHPGPARYADEHLVVHADHPLRTLRASAGILYCHRDELGIAAATWLSETLARWPACVLTAVVEDDASCLVYAGSGRRVRLSSPDPTHPDPVTYASMIYLWLSHGMGWDDLPQQQMWLDVGRGRQAVQVSLG